MPEPYTIEMSKAAHRVFKKLDAPVQERVKKEAAKIAADPKAAPQLKGLPLPVRSHHFIFTRVHWRIAYTMDEEARKVIVVMLGVRESFYEKLKRML